MAVSMAQVSRHTRTIRAGNDPVSRTQFPFEREESERYTVKIYTKSDVDSSVTEWICDEIDMGITVIARACDDNSGYIGRLHDFWSGNLIREFYGSTPQIVMLEAVNFSKKFSQTPVFTFA